MSRDFTAVDERERLDTLCDVAIHSRQLLYPVLDDQRRLAGVLTRGALLREIGSDSAPLAGNALLRSPVTVDPQDTLREVAQRFAEHSLSSAPVVHRNAR